MSSTVSLLVLLAWLALVIILRTPTRAARLRQKRSGK